MQLNPICKQCGFIFIIILALFFKQENANILMKAKFLRANSILALCITYTYTYTYTWNANELNEIGIMLIQSLRCALHTPIHTPILEMLMN
jgi:hypothetical protein